jgi:hypothetical protein
VPFQRDRLLSKQKLLHRFFNKSSVSVSRPILALAEREAGDFDPQNEPCPLFCPLPPRAPETTQVPYGSP